MLNTLLFLVYGRRRHAARWLQQNFVHLCCLIKLRSRSSPHRSYSQRLWSDQSSIWRNSCRILTWYVCIVELRCCCWLETRCHFLWMQSILYMSAFAGTPLSVMCHLNNRPFGVAICASIWRAIGRSLLALQSEDELSVHCHSRLQNWCHLTWV